MKEQITCLQDFFDWIEKFTQCTIREKYNDLFRMATPHNTNIFVDIGEKENIKDIIHKTIVCLEEFDVDDRFIEEWNENISPSQFVSILQEDKKYFGELADKLRGLE